MQLRHNGGAVLAGAAFGFLAGLAANPARKLAIQGVESAAGDWVAMLTLEHRVVEKVFDALLATHPRETAKRQGLLLKLVYTLNKHASEEENVVYPVVRGHDAQAASELVADHAEVKALLSELQYGIEKDDPRWLAAVRSLREKVVSHAQAEEETVFPKLRDTLTPEENTALTRRVNWEGVKTA